VEAAKWRALAVESDDDHAGGDGDEADGDVEGGEDEADEDEADEDALRLGGASFFFVNALFLYAIEQKAHGVAPTPPTRAQNDWAERQANPGSGFRIFLE